MFLFLLLFIVFFFLMIRPPPRSTRTDTLFPYTTLFRSQCEAEGFRRITFFPDRPDVLSIYSVRMEADKAAFPVLLANGDPVGGGDLDGGRHWAQWNDPYPKQIGRAHV